MCLCVSALHFRRKPCDNQTDSALTHMCTYICVHVCVCVCVCVAYLPLAALFISLFMTILVFMVSLPQLSDCRFYIYVVGWPARALQRHMVSLPYVCVCECMHVYETSCAWTFCFMVCLCCLFILLNSLVFIVFPSFVAAFILFVYFFFTHHLLPDIRCGN